MHEPRREVLNDNSIEMASSSEANADFSLVNTARRRSVSPTFLRALSLMKVTTVTSVPLSKYRRTNTDKNAAGSHTSANKKLKRRHKKRSQSQSVAASSTAVKTFVVKKEHVSKPKGRARKRSHATSFDEPQSIPVVVAKKTRKPAARATDKPTTKKQQHKASPPATKVLSSAPKSTVKPAENLPELTSAADGVCLWGDIVESDFKSLNYTTLLKNNQFTEEQVQAIRKSFQHLSQTFCRRPTKRERFMKTHECIECHYSVSHDCVSMDSSEYWTFGGNAPCIDLITPEEITMCLCNFTIFHSHNVVQAHSRKSKREVESPPRSPLPSALRLIENNRSANLECPRCYMTVSITNRNKDVCSDLMNFNCVEGRIRRRFFDYIHHYLDFGTKNLPGLSEFYSCSKLCCMLFHRCATDLIVRSFLPKQFYRPIPRCVPSEQMQSVQTSTGCRS